jgi:hypothetical protein
VASTCLLSQLINTAAQSIGENHARFAELIQAIRLGHLRLLSRLMAPGGFGILITDLVSADTLPGLTSIPDEFLTAALVEQVNRRNFFHGVNPKTLFSLFRTDPLLAVEVADAQLTSPWRWDAGGRLYAVYAIRFRKAL